MFSDFVTGFDNGEVNIEGYDSFSLKENNITDYFPFYYRLDFQNYDQLFNGSKEVKETLTELTKNINPFNTPKNGLNYFGLVSKKGYVGTLFEVKVEEYNETNLKQQPITYGVLGADELYLISHKSQIPGKDKIFIDKKIYGLDQDDIGITMKENTNSFVRGEKLLELLDLIVKFLLSHSHPFHDLPPSEATWSGVQKQSLRTEMANAYENILNKYIRIN